MGRDSGTRHFCQGLTPTNADRVRTPQRLLKQSTKRHKHRKRTLCHCALEADVKKPQVGERHAEVADLLRRQLAGVRASAARKRGQRG